MLKSIFQTSQDELLQEIRILDEEIRQLARMFDSQIQRQILQDVSRLVDTSMIFAQALKETEYLNFVNWLSAVPYTQHHKRHSDNRLPGSTQWIFEQPEYLDWKSACSSSIILLQGIPGSGKTHVVSSVIDAFLDEKRQNTLAPPLLYFYCGDSKVGGGKVGPEEVMRCLTRQLAVIDKAKREIHEQILLDYERRAAQARLDGFEVPRLTCRECADLMLEVLGANPAVIVIDGVDEVEEQYPHEVLEQGQHGLLQSLMRLKEHSDSVLKIFLSSRESGDISARLKGSHKLRVRESTVQDDMKLFVEACVSNAIRSGKLLNGEHSGLQHDLETFLLDRAGEMYACFLRSILFYC